MADSFGSVVQGVNAGMQGQQAAQQGGADQVNSYVQAVQTQQAKQQQAQMLQQKLDDSKWQAAKGMLNTYINASDPVQKAMHRTLQQRFSSMGYDPMIIDSVKDENMQQHVRTAMDSFGEDPEAAAKGQMMLKSVSAFEEGVPSYAEMAKQRAEVASRKDLLKIQNQEKERIAEMNNQAKLDVAHIYGGIRLDKNEAAAVNGLVDDSTIKPITSTIQQFKKDYDMIQDARTPDPKTGKTKGITPLKAEELVQSYVSGLKGMSARSVGQEREELAHKAQDIEQRLKGFQQKYGQFKGMIHYEDEPFLHEIEDDIRGLHGTLKDNLQQQLNSKLRVSGLPSVNNAQQAAYNQMMQGAELGYKPQYKNVVNPNQQQPPQQQQQQQTAPPQAAAPAQAGQNASKAPMSFEEFKKARASASGGQ
jgi:hypothetical protein